MSAVCRGVTPPWDSSSSSVEKCATAEACNQRKEGLNELPERTALFCCEETLAFVTRCETRSEERLLREACACKTQ